MNVNKFEETIQEIINNVRRYIEVDDYEEAMLETKQIINRIKEDYIEFLSNEIGIGGQIINYAQESFQEISEKIRKILEERKEKHIDTKTEVLKSQINNEQENKNSINDRIEESQTQINYEDKITSIIEDKINDSINQTKRALEYLGIGQNKIDDISYEMIMKRNQILKYSTQNVSDKLIELDKRLTKIVEDINEEYLKEKEQRTNVEEKFRDELAVDNTGNRIEITAKKNIEDIFNTNETNEKTQDSKPNLDPRGIF